MPNNEAYMRGFFIRRREWQWGVQREKDKWRGRERRDRHPEAEREGQNTRQPERGGNRDWGNGKREMRKIKKRE